MPAKYIIIELDDVCRRGLVDASCGSCFSGTRMFVVSVRARRRSRIPEVATWTRCCGRWMRRARGSGRRRRTFKWDLYQRVVRETTTQTGQIYFLKNGRRCRWERRWLPPEAKTVEYKGGKLTLFDPSQNHVTEMSAGANQGPMKAF